jgi:CheY-like chemotaxis protein
VVDDNADNRLLAKRFLTLAGARVDLARDGREGLVSALAAVYDLLIIDIQMPVMDGYEAVANLRRCGYAGPVLALTAHTRAEDVVKCLAQGFDSHLGKPITQLALIARVAQLVRRGNAPPDDQGESSSAVLA